MGKILIVFGLLTVLVGLVMQFAPHVTWFGKLPGDIRYEKEILNSFFGNHDDSFERWDQSAFETIWQIIFIQVDFL